MKFRALTLVLLISLIGFSCKKTTKTIGNNLQPTNNIFVDTIWFNGSDDVKSSTFTVPSLSTKQVGYSFIGNMNDPIFGNSNFDFYTQFSLSTSSLIWGDDAVADSMVLHLCYNGYYGDTTDKQLTVKIYEISELMYADSTYKSDMTLECETEELANMTFVPRPLTPIDTVLDRGVLSIPIDISLGEKLIANGVYETNDDFKEAFKGLHLVCDKNDEVASVISFNLTHSYTYLRLYYHNSEDTLDYDFTISSSDVRFNHYTHDYSNSEITLFDTVNNPKLYVQGAAGTRVWVKFPNIQAWARNIADSLNTNIAINEAKLILSGAVTDTAMYNPPAKLVAAGAKFDADTTYAILPDQYVSSEYFGGSYSAETAQVWFRITEYLQNVIQNGVYATQCDGILIYVDQGSSSPHRWAFYGPQTTEEDKRIRLEIVYSMIND